MDQIARHHHQGQSHRAATLGWLAAFAAAGAAVLVTTRAMGEHHHHPPDSAPGRASRKHRHGDYAVTGNTVTIHKPRAELYAFWRDFQNLAFMENVEAVDVMGDRSAWTIAGPLGQSVRIETVVSEDRPDELIAWRSVEGSDVESRGRVAFRDAPADRGTEVEAIIAYKPPAGEVGRWIAKLFGREPQVQGRRELKRFKMLMETGEIATARNRGNDTEHETGAAA
jgi:uncharacterized membrane protein